MNNEAWRRFAIAIANAFKGEEGRHFYVGATAIRDDGTVVNSHNKMSIARDRRGHAEYRLSKKLDVGSTVFVARVTKGKHLIACARPCSSCINVMQKRGVKRVYFTVSETEYDWMDLT